MNARSWWFVAAVICLPVRARAQDQAEVDTPASTEALDTTAGEFTPGKGFSVGKAPLGSLNISFYGLIRYVNQMGDATFIDHLGHERAVKLRNDINWHRSMIWFSGFALDPRLTYVLTVWSLPSTQQTLAFGNVQFKFARAATLGAGIGPTLTARSMQGSHPFWASSDRQMGEEFFRGGFSSGVWIKGEPIPRLHYIISVNTNLSQLGVTAANDSRDMAYSGSVSWMPTTGEFGQRGGVADFDEHCQLATRIGTSVAHARESRAASIDAAPNATQIRLSDGVLPFEAGALADGVTVRRLNYDLAAFDAGFKWRGFTVQAEYYLRWLSHFDATGPLPQESIFDHGFFVEGMAMVLRETLGVYASGTYVMDEFRRFPWEVSGGMSYYPMHTQSWRVNAHLIRVDRSPTGSNFGFYQAGQSGTTISIGTDVLL